MYFAASLLDDRKIGSYDTSTAKEGQVHAKRFHATIEFLTEGSWCHTRAASVKAIMITSLITSAV